MKEELTTKMHAEFTVSEDTEIQLRVWTAIGYAKKTGKSIQEVLEIYQLSLDDYYKYKNTVPK